LPGELKGTGGYQRARVRMSSATCPANASRSMTTCFLPAPRLRTATVLASASRFPTTPM